MTDFIPQTVAAKSITVSGRTLFDIAARELGDATQWNRIADLNPQLGGDPWVTKSQTILIPQPGVSNGGILTG